MISPRPDTFPDLLDTLLREDPGRPLVTFYDAASGERTELSVTTYANWVAKVASLLTEELDLTRGDTLLVDLPTHWLGPVLLGGAWRAGVVVTFPDAAAGDPDAVACGPGMLEQWAPGAADLPVLASALLPLAGRFPDGVPPGVLDLGVEVWSQPDDFVALDPPTPDDPAVPGRSHRDVLEAAYEDDLSSHHGRLLSWWNPASAAGLRSFLTPLARRGSVVWLVNATDGYADTVARDERVAHVTPTTPVDP